MAKEKKYSVYIHTNKINNKKYVGMTCLKPAQRWNKGFGYSNQLRFWNDIVKYGWDTGFAHEIIATDLDKEAAQKLEFDTIVSLETDNPEKGYNTNASNRIYSEMTELKAKSYAGVRRAVYCVELDKIFENAKAASRETGINNSHIGSCCKGVRKTAGGYHWEYREYHGTPVYCVENDTFYGSHAIAAAELGLHSASVKKVCDGKLQTTGKKHFRYATEEEILALGIA